MKIAIPCAEGLLCMHFGHCQTFEFISVDENNTITKSESLTPPPHEPGVYPKWVRENGADVVIAGGMGMRAQQLFEAEGVKVITGASAVDPKEIAVAFLENRLQTGSNACDH